MSVFMDKHVLSCEQVYTGSQIIIQGLFDERETEQGEKGDDLDHIFKSIARCIPLCYGHILTTQEMPKYTPHLTPPGAENAPFHWLLIAPFIDTKIVIFSLNFFGEPPVALKLQ